VDGLADACRRPYLSCMSILPRPSSPVAALRDLGAFMRQRSREQVIAGALALLITAIIVIEFLVDSKINTAPPPQIVEVELYPSNRTDAEIIADQKKDQAAREAAKKERQREFQKLGKQLGVE
jgi:hypothetical protein